MKFVTPDKWIPCDGIILEHNADVAVRTNKNVLVVAGPGASAYYGLGWCKKNRL